MVSNRGQYFFNPKTMQGAKLNANVVLVKMNGKDLYFDPGAQFAPFGLLPWYEAGTAGLRLDKDGGSWIVTTLPESSDSQEKWHAQLNLSEAGDLEGKLTITYTGLTAAYLRVEKRNADDAEHKKFLEDHVKPEVSSTAELDLTNKPDWTKSEAPLVAEFNVKIPGWASTAGKRMMLPAAIFAGGKHVFEQQTRVHPIYLTFPYEDLDDITIDLPPGWQVSSVPPPQNLDGHVIVYTMKLEDGKGSLHMTRKFGADFLFLDQKYYPALRNFFQAVRTGDEEQVILQRNAATASN
jgi:hypothetical protein